MKRQAGALIFMLLLAAVPSCRSTGLPTKYYLIDTDPAIARSAAECPFSLGIGKIRAPSRYRDQIVYRTSEYDLGFYGYSKWAESPDEMARRALKNIAARSGLFRRVDYNEMLPLADLVLEGELGSFDQVIAGEKTYAVCEMTLFLLDGKSSAPLWSFTAVSEVRQEKDGEFAASMSAAVKTSIEDALADLERSGVLARLEAGKNGKQ